MTKEVSIQCSFGLEALELIPQVAKLHVEVFRDFPYLYDRDVAFEERLLAMFFANADSPFFVLAYAGEELVGASTARSLSNRLITDGVEDLFRSQNYEPEQFYYLADSVLQERYRGRGIGRAFFSLREEHALKQGFASCCFCAVQRPTDHPLRQDDYYQLNGFWESLGYTETADLETEFTWKDLGESQTTAKKMRYWIKELSSA
jgi:GNAT superfamily N-acetyltransferase